MAKTVSFSPDVQAVLARCTLTASSVTLPKQLERDLYLKVDKVLKAAGGRWNKSAGAHVFTNDPRQILGLEAVATGKVTNHQQTYQIFPTPGLLAQRMVGLAGIMPGDRVLEPSAGDGSIALAARAAGAAVKCVEIRPEACMELEQLGFTVAHTDFLTLVPNPRAHQLGGTADFDAVLMNPPFSGDQDCAHVLHAYSFLRPGGVLVAVTGTSWFDKDAARGPRHELQELYKRRMGRLELLARGTFADTNIATALLVIRKAS